MLHLFVNEFARRMHFRRSNLKERETVPSQKRASRGFLLSMLVLFLAGCTTTSNSPTTFVASENLDEMVIPMLEVAPSELPPRLSGKLTVYGETPIFEEGSADSWDKSLVFPGAVFFHGGLYHMFYNGLTIERGISGGGIGYAISADGVAWYRMADEPLFDFDETIGEDDWLQVNTALIEEDGRWVLYMTSQARGITEALPTIYRATAPAPNGPWTFDDIPMLEPGETGEWDAYGVNTPTVVKTEKGYLMYYLNSRFDNRRGISAIGMATSADGIVWKKYNDPVTEERFSASDPVFIYESEGEFANFYSIQDYSVWQDTTGFSMLYSIGRNNGGDIQYMTSEDGLVWEPTPADEVVLALDDVAFLDYAMAYKVLYVNQEYSLYFYGGLSGFGDIYLAKVTE